MLHSIHGTIIVKTNNLSLKLSVPAKGDLAESKLKSFLVVIANALRELGNKQLIEGYIEALQQIASELNKEGS